jgi:hypothetical protein
MIGNLADAASAWCCAERGELSVDTAWSLAHRRPDLVDIPVIG